MRPMLVIGAKELRQRMRDRSAIIIGIVVPFTLAGILSLALSDVADDDFTAAYAVADEDAGALAERFVVIVEGLDFAEVVRVESALQAQHAVDSGDVSAAFVVPRGFSAAVERGDPARLEVIADPEAPIGAQIAESVARSFASDVNAVQLAIATAATVEGGPPSPELIRAVRERSESQPPVAMIEPAVAEDREVGSATFFAIGMAVFFMFFTVEFGVRSILEERQSGTMARLLAAPLRPAAIIGGKALAAFAVGTVSMAILVVASDLLLGASWGDPAGVALLTVAGVLAAMGLTALVATLASTPEQAGNYASVVAVTFGLLGGSFFPLGEGVLATVGLATPHAWLLRGLRDLAGGAGASDILLPLGVVLAFAAVTGAMAVARAGRLVERP